MGEPLGLTRYRKVISMRKNKIPSHIISQIIDKTDLVQLISQYTAVNRNLKAVCLFHKELKPSLSIHPNRKFFRCFGCGAAGDAISFVRKVNKLSFLDSVHLLAGDTGVSLPKSERFKNYLSRKWQKKKRQLDHLKMCLSLIKQAEINKAAELRNIRKSLPVKRRWNSWDSKDFLREQLIDYSFDNLSDRGRSLEREFATKMEEIRNE